MQAYQLPSQTSFELMAYRLDKLATLGVRLYITEYLFPSFWAAEGGVNTMSQVGPHYNSQCVRLNVGGLTSGRM